MWFEIISHLFLNWPEKNLHRHCLVLGFLTLGLSQARGDDFALWALELLARTKVLGCHTEPFPPVSPCPGGDVVAWRHSWRCLSWTGAFDMQMERDVLKYGSWDHNDSQFFPTSRMSYYIYIHIFINFTNFIYNISLFPSLASRMGSPLRSYHPGVPPRRTRRTRQRRWRRCGRASMWWTVAPWMRTSMACAMVPWKNGHFSIGYSIKKT